jgi:hypothetical protein
MKDITIKQIKQKKKNNYNNSKTNWYNPMSFLEEYEKIKE